MDTFFFPRGKGPLISVLIPTRGRPDHLCHSIDSLCSLAKDPSLLEFILKIDDDDKETQDIAEKIASRVSVKKIISPRGNGYHDMHLWINEMCGISSGSWVAIFNDDARMKTLGWDQTILNIGTNNPWPGINSCCLLYLPTQGRPHAQEFVMVRREVVDILGHFSQSPHCDNWIHGVMSFMGCCLTVNVFVEHLSDTIGDKTRRESEEAYKTTQESLTSISSKRLKIQDTGRIFSHLAKAESSIIWKEWPEAGWSWWKSSLLSNKESVFVTEHQRVYFFKDGSVIKEVEVSKLGGHWARRE